MKIVLRGILALAAAMVLPARGADTPTDVVVSEGFESTPVGQIPAGFTKTGAVEVVEGVAHSGKRCLQIDPAVHGPRFITLAPSKLAALGGEHWGRLYFRMKLPAPKPVARPDKALIIHGTFVSGRALSPLRHDSIEVRMAGLILNNSGQFHYLYNVQPRQRPEFGKHGSTVHRLGDNWTLLEWHVDYATQSYELYVDGEPTPEVAFHQGAGQFEGAEIPAKFQTLSVGWTNYQPASGEGFTVWIDDVALGKKRIGPLAVPGSDGSH